MSGSAETIPENDLPRRGRTPTDRGARYHVVACRVIEDELKAAAAASPAAVIFTWLEQGLHNEPDRLREAVQQAIDDAEEAPGDAVVLGYGLCSRGVEGVRTRTRPLVVARAHDCITLLLGCRHRYADYVATHPGTYWYSPGWNRCHTPPGPQRRAELLDRYTREYGADTAAYLVEVEQGKKFNFQTKMMGIAATPIGRVAKKPRVTVKGVGGRQLVDLGVEELREAFRSGFSG